MLVTVVIECAAYVQHMHNACRSRARGKVAQSSSNLIRLSRFVADSTSLTHSIDPHIPLVCYISYIAFALHSKDFFFRTYTAGCPRPLPDRCHKGATPLSACLCLPLAAYFFLSFSSRFVSLSLWMLIFFLHSYSSFNWQTARSCFETRLSGSYELRVAINEIAWWSTFFCGWRVDGWCVDNRIPSLFSRHVFKISFNTMLKKATTKNRSRSRYISHVALKMNRLYLLSSSKDWCHLVFSLQLIFCPLPFFTIPNSIHHPSYNKNRYELNSVSIE